MLSQGNNKTASLASSQTTTNNNNGKQNDEKMKKETTTSPTTSTSTSRDLGQDLITPAKTTTTTTTIKGKMVTVHVLIADHPTKKTPLPLTIDVTQPAHVLVEEIAKLTHIPLAKLSVETGGWPFPQDGLKRSCKVNWVHEGANFVASKLKKDGTYAFLLKDETN